MITFLRILNIVSYILTMCFYFSAIAFTCAMSEIRTEEVEKFSELSTFLIQLIYKIGYFDFMYYTGFYFLSFFLVVCFERLTNSLVRIALKKDKTNLSNNEILDNNLIQSN